MATPKLRKCKSATFKSTAMLYATAFSYTEQGSEVMARGDGATYQQFSAMEGISHEISVTCIEGPATVNDANLRIGANGILVCVAFQQAVGAGSASADKTFTWATVTCLGGSPGMPLDGQPTITYRFRAYSVLGDGSDLLTVS